MYTHDGRDIKEHFDGAILYSDGSCSKDGHVSMHRAGWALVALKDNGDLAAATWGQVGEALPQTSPASEFVAGLAASGFRAREVRTDFAGLASLGIASYEALSNRKTSFRESVYRLRAGAPRSAFPRSRDTLIPALVP